MLINLPLKNNALQLTAQLIYALQKFRPYKRPIEYDRKAHLFLRKIRQSSDDDYCPPPLPSEVLSILKMENKNNHIFGKALKNLRIAADLTQENLAFDAELDRTFISLLERGKRSPTLDTMLALCKALGISLVELSIEIEKHLKPLKQ